MTRFRPRELALFVLVAGIAAFASLVCALVFQCAEPPRSRSLPHPEHPEVHR